MGQNITIISFGYFERTFLENLAEAVKHEYNVQVLIRETRIDLSDYYDPGRRQYNGNNLLKMVDACVPAESFKAVGLFSVDLFIPILTYIFGQAYLNGHAAITSVARLSNERYGMETNENLVLERLIKEVIHELGHTFGLIHCHVPGCVMQSSTYVEDIDQKAQHLCQRCRGELGVVK